MLKNFAKAAVVAIGLAACSSFTPESEEAKNPKAREAMETCLAKTIQGGGGQITEKTVDGDVTNMSAVNPSRGFNGHGSINYKTGVVDVTVEKGGKTATISYDYRYAQLRQSNANYPADARSLAVGAIHMTHSCRRP